MLKLVKLQTFVKLMSESKIAVIHLNFSNSRHISSCSRIFWAFLFLATSVLSTFFFFPVEQATLQMLRQPCVPAWFALQSTSKAGFPFGQVIEWFPALV